MNDLASSIVIDRVAVVDVETGQVRMDQSVHIAGDRIVGISPSGAEPHATASVVDGQDGYLIPGLWDMHVHGLQPSRWDWGSLLMVANGVTGMRNPATTRPLADIATIRSDVAAGRVIGPRFIAAGPLIDGLPPIFGDEFPTVGSPEEMRALIASFHEQGADFIKIYTRLDRESFYAAIDEAGKRGLPVAGHVPLSVTVAEASDAGMKSVEHSYRHRMACVPAETEIRSMLTEQIRAQADEDWSRYVEIEESTWQLGLDYSSDKTVALGERLARNGTWFVPTAVEMRSRFRPEHISEESFDELFSDARLEYFPPATVTAWRDQLCHERGYLWGRANYSGDPEKVGTQIADDREREVANRLRMTGDLHAAGAGICAGTDASFNFPLVMMGFSLHEELELMVQSGLTSLQALQTATLNPARFLDATDRLGTIAEGKVADLVLLDANPLEDIRNTTRIRAVVLNGKPFDRTALDQLLAQAKAIVQPHQ